MDETCMNHFECHVERWVYLQGGTSITVILRYLYGTPGHQKNGEFLQRDASCENSQQRQRTRSAGQETLRGQGHKSRLRYATVRLQRTGFSFFFDQEDAEHTVGSKGECSEPNLHRLTDKVGVRRRTAQQPRIVVAARFACTFLNYSRYLRW